MYYGGYIMYTTDRAEQFLDDIRKVFLLYKHGIIDNGTVKDMANRIIDLYITDTVVLKKPIGQSCKTCIYYRDGFCYGKKYAPAVDANSFCDDWVSGITDTVVPKTTDTVVPKTTGQSCKTCLYYGNTNYCYENEAPIDPNGCCDRWQPGIKADMTEGNDYGKT